MDKTFGKILGVGLAVVLVIIAFVFFAKRDDHLAPTGTVLKERTIDLNETTSLLLLDIRIVNDSNVTMSVSNLAMSVDLKDGGTVDGHVLGKSDLMGTFGYFPLLGEKFNEALAVRDEIPPHSKVDRMISASFEVPLAQMDARKKVTLLVEDASGAKAEITGK
jgi:hypothetical protein